MSLLLSVFDVNVEWRKEPWIEQPGQLQSSEFTRDLADNAAPRIAIVIDISIR